MRLDESYQLLFKDYPDILNVEQVANILNSSPKTVYRLLKNQVIKSITVGRRYCIPKVCIFEYMELIDKPEPLNPSEKLHTQKEIAKK